MANGLWEKGDAKNVYANSLSNGLRQYFFTFKGDALTLPCLELTQGPMNFELQGLSLVLAENNR